MLEGLQRLLSNGKFTESKTQKQIEIEFLRASDSINAFLKERTKKAIVTVYTSRTEAYNAYKDYCETYGIEIESPQEFTKTLQSTKGIRSGWGTVNAKRCRVWQGLELLKDNETEQKEPISFEKVVVVRLNQLLQNTKPIDKSKFYQIGNSWVYETHLIATNFYNLFAEKNKEVCALNLPEQYLIHNLLTKKLEIKTRLGTVEENIKAKKEF